MRIILWAAILTITISSCREAVFLEPKYKPGQMVTLKLTGARGQVLRSWCPAGEPACLYFVRVSGYPEREYLEFELEGAK